MTLTFMCDLDIINVHHHTEFDHPRSNGFRDTSFGLVIKIMFFDLVTLTFDL